MATYFNAFKVLVFFKPMSELAILFVSIPKEDVSEKTSKISMPLLIRLIQFIGRSSVSNNYRYLYKNKSVVSIKNM